MKQLQTYIQLPFVQYTLLVLYLGIIAWAFLPHIFQHTPQYIDSKTIVTCPTSGLTIGVTISSTGFTPSEIHAHTCDTLEFTTTDSAFHQVAFGDHPYHLAYPQYQEQVLGQGETARILLTAYGTYKLHDHLHEELEATLIVEQ